MSRRIKIPDEIDCIGRRAKTRELENTLLRDNAADEKVMSAMIGTLRSPKASMWLTSAVTRNLCGAMKSLPIDATTSPRNDMP